MIALQDLAKSLIEEFNPFIVAVTGSVGKTTIKEFLYTIVKDRYHVSKTYNSYNGQIGLPLSVLNAKEDSEMLILEMGISHPFEMDTLIEIAPPQIAILGKVTEAHIGYFDSKEHLASEKAKIFRSKHLRMGFVHKENLSFECIRENHTFKKYTYASQDSDYFLKARNEHVDLIDRVKQDTTSFFLPFKESHLVENFLIAAVVSHYLNLSWETIRKRAKLLKPFDHRFEKHLVENILYIDDTYNCNPTNLSVGLQNIPKPQGKGRIYAVIGEMRELGDQSKSLHEKMGRFALDYVDELFCFGNETIPLFEAFRKENQQVTHTLDKNQICQALKEKVNPGDIVYIKGGNSNRLWEILDKLFEKV